CELRANGRVPGDYVGKGKLAGASCVSKWSRFGSLLSISGQLVLPPRSLLSADAGAGSHVPGFQLSHLLLTLRDLFADWAGIHETPDAAKYSGLFLQNSSSLSSKAHCPAAFDRFVILLCFLRFDDPSLS